MKLPYFRPTRRGAALFMVATVVLALLSSCVARVAEQVSVQSDPAFARSALETLFLTWEHDPTTTMTFVWLAIQNPELPLIRWSTDGAGIPADGWREATGSRAPFGPAPFDVCRVSLKSLQPDTTYRFLVPGSGRELRFRTAPTGADAKYSFVSGGDAGPWAMTTQIGRHAAGHDPLFAVLGGDLAYGNGQLPQNWVAFLARWHESMVTASGRAIPLLVAIGNHEVNNAVIPTSRVAAPYFYALFHLYRTSSHARLDIGESSSFLFLDTGHTAPIAGEQTAWLESQLMRSANVPHLFVVYHIPAFPSYRDYDAPVSVELRKTWVPLFERHGVDVVFENHDHTYKRTPLIRNGKKAPDGVLYLGDGSWGVYARIPNRAEEHWYLDATRDTNHFILTQIDGARRNHAVFDEAGVLIDAFPQPEVSVELVTQPKQELGLPVYDRSLPLQLDVTATAAPIAGKKALSVTGVVYVETETTERRRVADFGLGRNRISLDNLAEGRNRISIRGTVSYEGSRPQEFAWMDKLSFRVLSYTPRKSVTVTSATPGLRCSVYQGSFRRTAFAGLPPVAGGIVRTVGLQPAGALLDRFGLVFEGFLRIDEPGLYRFSSLSDDGSRIFLGEELVVDNDGRHTATERAGVIALDKGMHPLRVEYFQYTLERQLEVRVTTAGAEPQPLAPNDLFHSRN